MPKGRESAADAGVRQVRFGAARDDSDAKGFPSNAIKSSKYTVFNFLPKNLWEQLHKAANAYFLGISFIMFLGNHTPLFTGTINFLATFMTLVIMMAFSAVIAALDDRQRHLADKQANSQVARRILIEASGSIKKDSVQWQDIAVGDVLIIKGGEDLPADLVPLACPSDEGECHVSTANLDGESNLKVRRAVTCTQELLCSGADLAEELDAPATPTTTPHGRDPLLIQVLRRLGDMQGVVSAEAPQRSIHNFNGAASAGKAGAAQEEALGPQHLLLRGTQLRNIAWCVGLVVYTGRQTRMAMNSTKAPSKYANLEKTINVAMVVVVGAQALLALVSAFVYTTFSQKFESFWYLSLGGESPHVLPEGLSSWLTFFVLYSNLMPISLYATMEVCNFAQASFIRNDLEMYDEEQDVAASARATNLGHELGQVSYVFSDKTGTLTQNVMELKRVSIADQVYGQTGDPKGFRGGPEVMEAKKRDPHQAELIDAFLEVLAVSHTVVAVPTDEGAGAEAPSVPAGCAPGLRYEAESPDEAALVEAAAGLGWTFTGRRVGTAAVAIGPPGGCEVREYEVLALNAFNSSRKRQSVIVRKRSGEVLLLAKGADNIMLQRAATAPLRIKEQLTDFAKDGLRTLVLGRRALTDEQFGPWYEEYQKAQSLLTGRAEALEAVAEEIEKEMDIIGITAIEDKLQVGVQDTIVSVREAGIKLWVLTGDKLETAQNIGFSTRVLSEEMTILVLDAERGEQSGIAPRLSSMGETATAALKGGGIAALLVTGQALEEIGAANLDGEFLDSLAMKCSVVIACRVSPSQKAQLVQLVRKGLKPTPVTLAIGDGANDVPMIQAAQVGVGIAGREGRQAANSADFSVAQFRYLQRLLLVHGRWNYRRACKFTLYSFWKNAVMVLLMFYYTFTAGYAGTSLFEDMIRASYNVILSWPIIATGVFDRDVSAQDALDHPELYETGRKGMDLNAMKLVETLLSAGVHSVVIACVLALAYKQFSFAGAGDYYTFGTAVFTWLIIAMNYRVAFLTTTWNWLSLAAQAVSFLMYVVLLAVYCMLRFDPNVFNPWMYWVPVHMASTPMFWLCSIAVPALAIVIDMFKAYLVLEFRPDKRDLILEQVGSGRLAEQQEVEAEHQVVTSSSSAPTSVRSSFNFDHPDGPPGRAHIPSLNRAATDTTFLDDVPHGVLRVRSPRGDLEEARESVGEPSNRPVDWALAQQALPSWQFVLTWRKVLVATFAIGGLLHLLGLLAWSTAQHERELWVPYDGEAASTKCPAYSNGSAVNSCELTFPVPEDFRPPLLLFYSVDPFHQNIPVYMQSVVSEQLHGRWGSSQSISKHCPEGTQIDGDGRKIFPCGLRATSVFNDTFEVLASPGASPLPLDRSGIAWDTDVERYRNPDGYPDKPGISWLFMRYPPSVVSKEDGVNSEAFAVWMRPQAMPMVLNPYGRLEQGLLAGQNLTLRINASFPVRSVGASKYFVLRTSGYLGVASGEFGVFCFSTGLICWACSAVVLAIRMCCARRPGEPRRFSFGKRRRPAGSAYGLHSRWCWTSEAAGGAQQALPAPTTTGPRQEF